MTDATQAPDLVPGIDGDVIILLDLVPGPDHVSAPDDLASSPPDLLPAPDLASSCLAVGSQCAGDGTKCCGTFTCNLNAQGYSSCCALVGKACTLTSDCCGVAGHAVACSGTCGISN